MRATALVLDVGHRGEAFTVEVPDGTRPLAALSRDLPLGFRETEGNAWFAFMDTGDTGGQTPRPDRKWMADTALWKLYIHAVLGGWEPPTREIDIFHFGSNPEQASRLAHHVIKGKKRGSTGWTAALERDGAIIPTPGLITNVTDGFGMPLCAIETERVVHNRFGDATVEIAIAEDEGDLSFEYWRDGHREYFETEAKTNGMTFDDDSMVFHEYFRVVRILHR